MDTVLKTLVDTRNKLFLEQPEKRNENEIDRLSVVIYEYCKKNHHILAVEEVIEALTSLGQTPSILYDDNGHFFIGGDGSQNIVFDEDIDKETTFDGWWIVPPHGWKNTIREALASYFEEV